MKKRFFILSSALLIFLSVIGFSDASLISKQPSSTYAIPDTSEVKEIMKVVENAYAIEAEAAYTFDLKKFPDVFANDPRFPVDSGTLDAVREMTENPNLESAGMLDYKLAYFSWWRDATFHAEELYHKAKAENRGLTAEEKKSLVDSYGRSAPARAQDSVRDLPLRFLSVNVIDDVATVILDDGPRTIELTLVLLGKRWYIAGLKGNSIHPQ